MADPVAVTTLEQVAAEYPQFGALLKIPGLDQFILQAVNEGWIDNPALFEAELQNTAWWKNTPEQARQFVVRRIEDPASVQADLDEVARRALRIATSLGITVDVENLPQFALIVEAATINGWDDTRIGQVFAENLLPSDPRTWGGTARSTLEQLQGLASEYGLPLSDREAQRMASDLLTGRTTEAAVQADFAELAKAMFPSIERALDRGLTVRQAVDPYVQTAAQMLEIAPDRVDLADGKWQRFLQAESKDGRPKLMSLAEWRRTLMSDRSYGWLETDNAKSFALDLVAGLRETFGMG